MPPDPPPLPRTKRFHPHLLQKDAPDTRGHAKQNEVNATIDPPNPAPSQPTQRLTSMDVNQLWEQLLTEKRDNGDMVVPANLVPIMSALLLSMKETTLRMNAMEAQLKVSNEATQRLDKLEQQIKALASTHTTPTTQLSPQNGLPAKPMSWTKVATNGLKISAGQVPQPPPANKIINVFRPSQVVIRPIEGKQPFKNAKPTEIIQRVNQALTQLEVTVAGRKLEIKGAAILPTGCIKLFTATWVEADWLLEHRTEWSTLADPDLITSPAVFPVVIDSVPTETYPDTDFIKQTLLEQNPVAEEKIHTVRWLSKPDETGQITGSILVNLLDKDLANMMIRGSVYFEGYRLRVRACKKTRVQCFRCQEPGHISLQCKKKIVCKYCGSDHDLRSCQRRTTEQPHCVRCVAYVTSLKPEVPVDKLSPKYAHLASSTNCPIRSKGLPTPASQSC